MENENIQQPNTPKTGGLKLMTVFIIVLALHVLVIGGVSAYSMLKGNSSSVAQEEIKQEPTSTEAVAPSSEMPGIDAQAVVADQKAIDANAASAVASPEVIAAPSVEPVVAAPTHTTSPLAETPATLAPAPQVAAVVPAIEAAPVTTKTASYTVSKGDTLSKIARIHGMKVADLKAINGLKSDALKIGQELKIKSGSSSVDRVANFSAATPSVKTVSTAATPAKASASAYVVEKGDTLTKIAKQFNTTPSAIMAANKLSDPRKLKIGMKLQIPGQSRQQMTEQQIPETTLEKPVAPSADFAMAK